MPSAKCERLDHRPLTRLAWPLQGSQAAEMEGENAPIGNHGGLCIVALAVPAGAQAQSVGRDFYKGKTITVIVGYTAGGGYDLYARALARHMGKHLPGNPNFIVQNITGAGSLNAANNLYNVAAKDGTVFGTFGRGLAMEPLIGTARVQFDATKFTWLGSGTNEISLCATWHTSPVKTWQDALKTSVRGRRRRRRLRSRHLSPRSCATCSASS